MKIQNSLHTHYIFFLFTFWFWVYLRFHYICVPMFVCLPSCFRQIFWRRIAFLSFISSDTCIHFWPFGFNVSLSVFISLCVGFLCSLSHVCVCVCVLLISYLSPWFCPLCCLISFGVPLSKCLHSLTPPSLCLSLPACLCLVWLLCVDSLASLPFYHLPHLPFVCLPCLPNFPHHPLFIPVLPCLFLCFALGGRSTGLD